MVAAPTSGVLNGQTMIIACPACSTRYAVPDNSLGVEGRTVRCAKCRHSWYQEGPEIVPPAEPLTEPAATADASAEPAVAAQGLDASTGSAGGTTQIARDISAPPPAPVQETAKPVKESASAAIAYDDGDEAAYDADQDGPSNFAHAPPFRPRRNIPRLLMIGAILFAVVSLAVAAYVIRFGFPEWVPVSRSTFAEAQPDLELDFPPNRQDRRTLPNGNEYFGASGTVTNVGGDERSVPSILIVMRDSRERIVYSWEVVPPKQRLAPGESVTINEAVTDVPKSAVAAEIGWKPG